MKQEDVQFRKLFDEYNEMEHEAHRVNINNDVVTDGHTRNESQIIVYER